MLMLHVIVFVHWLACRVHNSIESVRLITHWNDLVMYIIILVKENRLRQFHERG